VAGGNLCAVLLGNTLPRINGFFPSQVVERLGTKPVTPVTVPLAAVASDAGTAQVFWHGQAAKHLWDDVVKRGAAGAKLLVAVGATVITS
jgi:hypothetical protein